MNRPVLMVEVGGRGGVADYTQELVTALARRGHRIALMTARDHHYRAAPGVQIHGIVPWLRGHSALGRAVRRAHLGPAVNALRFVALLPRIGRLARGSAVVHMQGEYFPPLVALLALTVRAVRVPFVHTAHGTFDRGRRYPRSHRIVAASARTTIVHTEADLERLDASTAARATVIPHGDYGGLAAPPGRRSASTTRWWRCSSASSAPTRASTTCWPRRRRCLSSAC
jgi:glycosyltransferase involved in cell wall biosynthesis